MQRTAFRFIAAALLALLALPCVAAESRRPCLAHVPPVYPALARQMHVEGVITLLITVAPDGHVTQAKVQSGHPLLALAAEDAVRHWRYAPAAEPTELTVAVEFKL